MDHRLPLVRWLAEWRPVGPAAALRPSSDEFLAPARRLGSRAQGRPLGEGPEGADAHLGAVDGEGADPDAVGFGLGRRGDDQSRQRGEARNERSGRIQPPFGFFSSSACAASRPFSILSRIFGSSSGSGFRSRAWFHWNRASSVRPTFQ